MCHWPPYPDTSPSHSNWLFSVKPIIRTQTDPRAFDGKRTQKDHLIRQNCNNCTREIENICCSMFMSNYLVHIILGHSDWLEIRESQQLAGVIMRLILNLMLAWHAFKGGAVQRYIQRYGGTIWDIFSFLWQNLFESAMLCNDESKYCCFCDLSFAPSSMSE